MCLFDLVSLSFFIHNPEWESASSSLPNSQSVHFGKALGDLGSMGLGEPGS